MNDKPDTSETGAPEPEGKRQSAAKRLGWPEMPVMHTMDDAIRIGLEREDRFYPTAFMFEAWLGKVTIETVAEYSEKKRAADRKLQAGVAKRVYDEFFGHFKDGEIHHLFKCMQRFAEHLDPQSDIVFRAYGCMGADMPLDGWPRPAEVPREDWPAMRLQVVALQREWLDRLCDWVEALIHKDTHVHKWLSPVSFHPDADTREIASVGVLQRNYAHLGKASQERWQAHYQRLAEELGRTPKWKMMGTAMASDKTQEPHHPHLDQTVILLWPLVIRHGWTYRELMQVVLEETPSHRGYPCEREQDMATYCANVLGLTKGRKPAGQKGGKSAGRDPLPGRAVARQIFAS